MTQERSAGPIKRVGFGQRDAGDVLFGSWPLFRFAVTHVPALAGRISPDNGKVLARAQIFVRYARRDDDHISCAQRLDDAALAAKLDFGGAAEDRQHFVRGAVIMVIVINAIAPASAPAV